MKTSLVLIDHAPCVSTADVRDVVEKHLAQCELRLVSRWVVAVHEAGHFIAYEHEGMSAGCAEVWGCADEGWSGEARPPCQ